jgi:asparagine synthase (glutamine-hydrolysing)
VIDRPKQGFGLPLHEWLLSGLGDLARDEIETFMAGTDILDPGAVRAMMAQGGNVNVWNLLNLALWWKTYIR